MTLSGIVRRIDELGRVVIPKEIRKTLRIKEGDSLEIFASKEELVIKKYSPINNINTIAKGVLEKIETSTSRPCLITDTDKVICVSNSKYNPIIGEIMSDTMHKIIKNRKVFSTNKVEGVEPVKIYKNDNNEYVNQMIIPIVSNGDCYGAVVVFDFDKEKEISNIDKSVITFACSILSMNFEF